MERAPRALARDEVDCLRQAARQKAEMHGCLIDFLYLTGARIGEVEVARWTHDRGDELVIVGLKGSKERTLEVHPKLPPSLDTLRLLQAAEGANTASGLVFGRAHTTLYGWVKEAAATAGIEDVHPHTLRATAATVMGEAGESAVDIQRILGHSSLAVTQRYIASSRKGRAKAIRSL